MFVSNFFHCNNSCFEKKISHMGVLRVVIRWRGCSAKAQFCQDSIQFRLQQQF